MSEDKIKAKLIDRGFSKETLLNNRGLIGATIEETKNQQTMSEAEKFLEDDYFHLTLDCKRELYYIVMAMQEYADQEVERYKQEEWKQHKIKPTNDET